MQVPSLPRVAAAFASLLVLANCAGQDASLSTRNAPPDLAVTPEIGRSSASASDVACLAEAVYFEARGTGTAGETAVAHVVVNRAKSPKFPGTVCGVVSDGCQFSYRCDGRSDALSETGARSKAFQTAQAVLSGAPDFTKGALFFHAASMPPGWFDSRPRIGTFGGNVFYR